MMPRQITFALVTFLHDLFTVVWIGGLISLGLTVLPTVKQALGAGPQAKKLMAAVQQRQSTLVYISIVGLVLTGFLQARANPAFTGLFSFANPYSAVLAIKHIVVLAMILIALYRSLALIRNSGSLSADREKLSARLLFANILLGVVTLLLSGFSAALAASARLS